MKRVFVMVSLLLSGGVVHAVEEPQLKVWLEQNLAPHAELYRALHAAPELSFAEEETATKMAARLRNFGFEVHTKIGGHGVVGILKNGAGKSLLLRADLDALPVVEETKLPYASQVRVTTDRGESVGVMHACGHDMHMTMLSGALQYLVEHRDQWQGTLIAVFQPAEERGAGAKAMIADGLLTKFSRPNYALALHVAADKPAGKIFLRGGFVFANVDSVDITIHGRGGHGAFPHMTCDPIVIAAKLVVDLQTIVSREVKPIEPAVVTVGSIHSGTKHNIIPDACTLQLTVRTYGDESRTAVLEAIRRKTLAAAASADAPEPEVTNSEGTPALYNDPELAERLTGALKTALGEENVVPAEPTMGGEDFGRIGRAGIPIVMMSVGAVDEPRLEEYVKAGTVPSLHSSKFYPAIEETWKTGVTTLVTSAVELLAKK